MQCMALNMSITRRKGDQGGGKTRIDYQSSTICTIWSQIHCVSAIDSTNFHVAFILFAWYDASTIEDLSRTVLTITFQKISFEPELEFVDTKWGTNFLQEYLH